MPATRFITERAPLLISIDVPYITGREWIALDCVSHHMFDFRSVVGVKAYRQDHPWRWPITDDLQRSAAEQLIAAGIVAVDGSDRQSVALTAEGFLRAIHGAWGNTKLALILTR